jgi:phosphoserine phosphatase RsbU/P
MGNPEAKEMVMDIVPELLRQGVRRIAPGEALIKAGEVDQAAYYILEGALKIILGIEGSSEKVYYAHAGDWVGEIALVLKSPRTAHELAFEITVLAIEPSAVIRVTPHFLNSLSEISQLKIYRQISVLAAERIWELNEILIKTNRQIKSDLKVAAEFLQSQFPHPIKEEGPIRTDWRFVPCMHLGGDAFGYGWLDASLFSFYLLDVCGHGTKAALEAAAILNVFRRKEMRDVDFASPGQVLTGFNHTFPMENQDVPFFTIWYGVYDKKRQQLQYSSAGHPPAIFYGSHEAETGMFQLLRTPNVPIGIFPDSNYETHTLKVLSPGRILLYSDGVSELHRRNGTVSTLDEFIKRTQRYLKSPRFTLDWILRHTQKVRGGKQMDDDFTILQVDFV